MAGKKAGVSQGAYLVGTTTKKKKNAVACFCILYTRISHLFVCICWFLHVIHLVDLMLFAIHLVDLMLFACRASHVEEHGHNSSVTHVFRSDVCMCM